MVYSLGILMFFVLSCFFHGSAWCEPWTIVANGSPVSALELEESMKDRKVIVLDGAINRFKSLLFYPDCILGDFDSVEDPSYWGITAVFSEMDEESSPYRGSFGMTIIPAKDQNYTDLEKGILYCDAAGATSIVIIQASGGRMDHTLGNLGALKKYYQPDRGLVLLTEKEQIFYVRDRDLLVEEGVGGYCAIIGYPQATMTTSGLAYNGDEYLLQLGVQESICNTIAAPQASIAIRGEALVILPKASKWKFITKWY